MGSDKKRKSEKKKRKRTEDVSDESGSDSSLDYERKDKSSSKKHKKQKAQKSKKKKKGKKSEKHSPVPEEILNSAGQLTEQDYFEKHAEFSTWLLEEKEEYFNELSSEKSRSRFSKFVEAWNSGNLNVKFYKGIQSAPAKRTQHKWKFKGATDDEKKGPKLLGNTSGGLPSSQMTSEEERIAQMSKRLGFSSTSFKPIQKKPPPENHSPPRWKKQKLPDRKASFGEKNQEDTKAERLAELQAKEDRNMEHFRALVDAGGSAPMQIKKRQ
ncbi:hypothetical protein BSKO_11872 [Bryopsis sp. KO-2023]|nr:hypothetical protein BSKO_11872 [Bryopsis sp. KO-2023]